MGDTWEKTKAEAITVAGKYGAKNVKIPDPKVSYTKFGADMTRLSKEYDAAVDNLQAKIVAMKQQCGNVSPALKMYGDQIDKNNFGIDPKDPKVGLGAGMPAAQTAIDNVRNVLQNFVKDKLGTIEDINKSLDNAEKLSKNIEKLDIET
jgi:hypothetical protein